ncbi:MAG: hypothetical protein Q7S53_04720 [bacterium]|nr:hypothetical protein [bacterium]
MTKENSKNTKKEPLSVCLAILGKFTLPPGVQIIKIKDFEIDCLISYSFSSNITFQGMKLELETADCTIFNLEHKNHTQNDLKRVINTEKILEKSLMAVSELALWSKAKDSAQKITPYIRQVGRADVKYFFTTTMDRELILWKNELYWQNIAGMQLLSGFLGNMVVTNGPSTSPLPSSTRRILGSLDLINLGFYSESFITSFALLDDLLQETIKAGLKKKKMSKDEQEALIRGIKENRLAIFLSSVLKLCGWVSLEEENKELFAQLKKVNTIRNNIMHGSALLSREDALKSIGTILDVILFLKSNPFDYIIEDFPPLNIIQPKFYKIPKSK